MNKYLLQLKQEFGKCGSWAIWGENGEIEKIIKNENFESLIKPNIIFMGFNASYDLKKEGDWKNYHSELRHKKKFTWKREHCRKLAEVLQEDEFEVLKGAYMTDIIKNHYDSDSGIMAGKIKKDKTIIEENEQSLKKEMELLSKISRADKFLVICMGDASFKETKKTIKDNIYKIYHYANYGYGKVKERIRQDLREIIKNVR